MSDSDDDVPIGAQRFSAGAGKSGADAKSGDAAAAADAKESIAALEPAKENAAAQAPESSDSDDETIGEKFAPKKTGLRGIAE